MTDAATGSRRVEPGREPASPHGVPGPVWTLALWLLVIAALIAVSLLGLPYGSTHGARVGGLLYAVVAAASLLVLGSRTPRWYLYLQMTAVVVLALWRTAEVPGTLGVLTSSLGIVAVAAYVASWTPLPVALAYVAGTGAGLLAVLWSRGLLDRLLLSWVVLVVMALAITLTLGRAMTRLREQAVTDPLTGLLNRTGLFVLVDQTRRPGRTWRPVQIVVLDLDGLKAVNDSRGHAAGDAVLRAFAEALRQVLRTDDVAVRSGGDEFLILLPQTDADGAHAMARRLRAATPVAWSYGTTEWGRDETFDAAVARADQAMYADKQRRRPRA